MRLNKYIAQATGASRRQADNLIAEGKVIVDGEIASFSTQLKPSSIVSLNGELLSLKEFQYILLNKPVGYVCSRRAQGEKPTIYELLPPEFHGLKVAGRLDADSRGLVILTNDGDFAHQLMHPSFEKQKSYLVRLDRELNGADWSQIEKGIELDDGTSKLQLKEGDKQGIIHITMHEGRNRQIRRTFNALGYTVIDLQRLTLGGYTLEGLAEGTYAAVPKKAA
jgi:23S rRNA pseudouridine2605 synthase